MASFGGVRHLSTNGGATTGEGGPKTAEERARVVGIRIRGGTGNWHSQARIIIFLREIQNPPLGDNLIICPRVGFPFKTKCSRVSLAAVSNSSPIIILIIH